MNNDDIVRLAASRPRRAIMLVMLAVLGALLVMLGFTTPSDQLAFKALFLVLGLGFLALLPNVYRGSNRYLVLREAGLFDENDNLLVPVENVRAVERGAFAFKPSNGFLLRLKTAQPRSWVPGLWWSQGKRFGVGGVISAGEAKSAAEVLASMAKAQN